MAALTQDLHHIGEDVVGRNLSFCRATALHAASGMLTL
jgi:hypothetical protein